MLPAREQVHRRGVDLLHDTQSETLHLGAVDGDRVCRVAAAEGANAGAGTEAAGGADIRADQGCVLVVIPRPLAVEDRGAQRIPGPLDEGLQIPSVGRRRTGRILVLVHAVEAKPGWNVHDGRASLVDVGLGARKHRGLDPGVGVGGGDFEVAPVAVIERGDIPEIVAG